MIGPHEKRAQRELANLARGVVVVAVELAALIVLALLAWGVATALLALV